MKTLRATPRLEPGFSLVELLTAIAIIGVLAALVTPAAQQVRARGRAAQCVNNLHQLGLAIQVYAQENSQKFPAVEPMPSQPIIPSAPLPSLRAALLKCVQGSDTVFRCPSDKVRWPVEDGSYEWCYTFNNDLVDAPQAWRFNIPPERAAVLYDYDNVHGDQGGTQTKNVLYADGHVKGL